MSKTILKISCLKIYNNRLKGIVEVIGNDSKEPEEKIDLDITNFTLEAFNDYLFDIINKYEIKKLYTVKSLDMEFCLYSKVIEKLKEIIDEKPALAKEYIKVKVDTNLCYTVETETKYFDSNNQYLGSDLYQHRTPFYGRTMFIKYLKEHGDTFYYNDKDTKEVLEDIIDNSKKENINLIEEDL